MKKLKGTKHGDKNDNGSEWIFMLEGTDDDNNVDSKYKVNSVNSLLNSKNGSLMVDCGATAHVTDDSCFWSIDESFKPGEHFIELADGKRANNVALKRGKASEGFCLIHGHEISPVTDTAQMINGTSRISFPSENVWESLYMFICLHDLQRICLGSLYMFIGLCDLA